MSSSTDYNDLPAAVTERANELRERAEQCRRLTSSVLDRRTFDALQSMADECEAEAEKLAKRG